MPTLYWLCGARENVLVGRLEATGGVNQAEAEIDPQLIADAHERYAAERDALIPTDHGGPRPFGGVAGTRIGVKCLHAHFGWWLAGGNDPIGQWVADKLSISRSMYQLASQQAVGAVEDALEFIGRSRRSGGTIRGACAEEAISRTDVEFVPTPQRVRLLPRAWVGGR